MIVSKNNNMKSDAIFLLWLVFFSEAVSHGVLMRVQSLFYGFSNYSASAVRSWFSLHRSGWYLVSSVWLLRNQISYNVIATACMADLVFH